MARAVMIILDGIGIGGAPDAADYGDAGSDTLGNTASTVGGLSLPVLQRLGLGNIHPVAGVTAVDRPQATHGSLREISAGKDSTTGHWELMGLVTGTPFPTYPDGFPTEVLKEFTRITGYEVLGNEPASGTEIIQRLGDEHVATGKLIVYTSADSVFQIAAHEQVVPLAELYTICEQARALLVPPHQVSRVIARPFIGQAGEYVRTPNRHDYSIDPPAGLLLPVLQRHGVKTMAIGKIYDLYAGRGIDEHYASRSNAEGMQQMDRLFGEAPDNTFLLLNLVDFDMLWGHRNDPEGLAQGLEEFDSWLAGFLPVLGPDDLLIMTADHGNDPTSVSTDHSRELVPVLAYRGKQRLGKDIGRRETFADVGATVADIFDVPAPEAGTSFLAETFDSERS